MIKLILLVLIVTIIITFGNCSQLQDLSDENLIQLIKNDEFVIVLFSKKNCPKCDEYEIQLTNLKNDFKEILNAAVVRSQNSQLTRMYSPITKEPAIIFFRHGIPLLYDGPITEQSIFEQFNTNREPIVKELADETFEHLTQSSSGATTGDWFILFYTQECVDCQRLSAVWEAVGAALKNRVNVARVNSKTIGKLTSERFNVHKAPEFIFIRQGKFYRYEIGNFDIKSFVSFAQEWYRNAKVEKVKLPTSPFDDLVSIGVQFLKDFTINFSKYTENLHPKIISLSLGLVGLLILTYVLKKIMKKTIPSKSTAGSAAGAATAEQKQKKKK